MELNKYLITSVFLAIALSLNAQGYCDFQYNANWVWSGGDTSLNQLTTLIARFDQDSLSFETETRTMYMGTQNCSMSDSSGNLLFYSNGCYINDNNHMAIPGSNNLNPGIIDDNYCIENESGYIGSQSMIVLPQPSSDSIFLVFHKRGNFIFAPKFAVVIDRLYVTMVNPYNIDISRITDKSKVLLADTALISGNMTAIKHGNGSDWWLITHTVDSTGFIKFLITSDTIEQIETQYIGGITSFENDGGQLKASPDGNNLALYHPKSGVALFDFDRNSGMLSNYKSFGQIDSTFIVGGCEFSPSGRFIYINTMNDVYQYDITDQIIQESEIHIGEYDGYLSPFATLFLHIERAPNGKIYLNCPNGVNVLHVINNPNEPGLACNFVQHDLILPVKIYFSMPHFPNYNLGPIEDELCEQFTVSTSIPTSNQVEVTVYPNPAHGHITIDLLDYNGEHQIEIYSIQGVLFDTFTMNNRTMIDISQYQNGIYIVRVINVDNRNSTSRLIIVNN